MRFVLLVALFSTPVITLAQRVNHSAGGCGPANVNFEVSSPNDGAPPPVVQNGKGLVYVIQVMENPSWDNDAAITRVGMDGAWKGANHGNTYFYFSVNPGPHDLCVDWQSSELTRSKLVSAMSLGAVAGATYYVEVRTHDETKYDAGYVKIKLLDVPEARLLLGSSSRVTSTPKK